MSPAKILAGDVQCKNLVDEVFDMDPSFCLKN